jgi:predicted dienelactone hydrolase
MKRIARFLAPALVLALAPPVLAEAARPAVSVAPLAVPAAHRNAPLEGTVFHPAGPGGTPVRIGENAVFAGLDVLSGAPVRDGTHPLVVLSHGLGGHAGTLSWLAAGLAGRGAVVVAVNHPGSTVGDFDMHRAMDHGLRAKDLSTAIDAILADPDFGPRIDPGRIHAAGFSYGGWTALSVGGLRGDLAALAGHCAGAGESMSHCRDLRAGGVDLATLDPGAWDASYKDGRIRSMAAIDPALHHGLTAGDAADLVPDVLLVGLGTGDDRLPATDFGPGGSGFAAIMPGARTLVLSPATHFSALMACKPDGAAILEEEDDDPVCTDPAGAGRGVLHAAMVAAIAEAFDLD